MDNVITRTPIIDFINRELIYSESLCVNPTILTKNLLILLNNEDLSVSISQIVTESNISKNGDYPPVITAALDAIALTAIYLISKLRAKTEEDKVLVGDMKKKVCEFWVVVDNLS
jgi:hypothetical protein